MVDKTRRDALTRCGSVVQEVRSHLKDYTKIANTYAEQVVEDEILACIYVKQAAQRHLDDLAKSKKKSAQFVYETVPAHRVCQFLEYMPYTKGVWAAKGQTLVLQPWQTFNVCAVFGWLRVGSLLRKYRVVYIEVPKKNGKSEWTGGICDYALTLDGVYTGDGFELEYAPEVYSGATTQDQARYVFDAGKTMARRNSDFKELGVEIMASNLSIPARNGKFEPLIGKPGDGGSSSFSAHDEYHEHATDEQVDTIRTGQGARQQPVQWIITTAGSNKAGPCYAMRGNVIKMLNGSLPNEELWGIIYTIDKGDDWTTEEALRKANPNYDVSVSGDFLKAQIRDAVQSPRKQNITKTKHLNVWVGAKQAWMNMESWAACADPDLKEEDFIGEPCLIGLDLASKLDLSCKAKWFERDGIWYLFVTSYLPEERVNTPGLDHYAGWMYENHLVATDGNVIDFDKIKEDILGDPENDIAGDAEKFSITAISYDEKYARQLANELTKEGINAVEVRMTVSNLSEPMKQMQALVEDGKLVHDDNPVMNWMVGNVVERKSKFNEDVYPIKEQDEDKIDGPVAAMLALALRDEEEATSVYDERGILTL